ncbi:MAG: hypothetical protein A3C84_03165 [Candidatus Ryanbacteria bacterium RIFCSPHIGHO2_02_FULL_48_12]|nr:MAG: hypothetical protein A3C84_03165 [Candidatus Ryanbacteria bacterium RIFCSPHIGHO2_02_FULL_48_12]
MFEIFVTIMGVVMSLGYYPQAYKIYTNKSAQDISLSMYVIMAVGTCTWFLYGIYLRDWIIVSGFALGVLGSWLVLGLSIYYKMKETSIRYGTKDI